MIRIFFSKNILFVFLILFSNAVNAQLEKKDSLLQLMRTSSQDTVIAKACVEISEMFFGQSNDSLFLYSVKALDIINKSNKRNKYTENIQHKNPECAIIMILQNYDNSNKSA